jgi:hypothetical protein
MRSRRVVIILPPALDHVPCGLGCRPGNKVCWIATSSIVAQVLDLKAFRDGFYP